MLFEKIQSLATSKGLTIAEIERKAQLGNGTISKWRIVKPSAINLSKVAKILEVDINILLPEVKL